MKTENRRLLLLLALLTASMVMWSQMMTPVKWRSQVKMTGERTGEVLLNATIDEGWHLYDTQLPEGGPQPTTVEWQRLEGVKLDGKLTSTPAPHKQHDPTFEMDLSWWTGKVQLRQRFTVTDPHYAIEGRVRYMACNDETCTAPTTESFSFKGDLPNFDKQEKASETDSAAVAPDSVPVDTPADTALAAVNADTWAPVTLSAADEATSQQRSLWYVFWTCFAGGLLALFTPCVWPIIPMTVSFFLKRSGSRSKGIRSAVLYGLSIVVIYVALGLLITAAFGPSTLNAIATSAVCNVVFFLLLVVFAISFFGGFEIKLPSSWGNRMDQAAGSTTGVLSIFFMAFTLAIVSFSCTGPIIGTLLVEAASQGERLAPAVGMLGFAVALAIPFTLFALFPSWLKQMPRSGGWMNTVKVVLGFIELALSLKFLSVADLAYGWHILDREVFLALWIAIFALMGFYLLGIFRFRSDGEPSEHGIGVTRFFLALASLAFTAYLVPGLWGAPLRGTSAFVPPLYTQDFNLYGDEVTQFDDYDEGMRAAAQNGRRVFLDFSGFGCVNCRKMDGAVIDKPQVKQLLTERFVTIQLMVDDKTPLPAPRYVEENGKQTRLDTRGDLWSYLQRHKFGSNSQPYYVILDAEGQMHSGPFVYREDVDSFVKFLEKGLQ